MNIQMSSNSLHSSYLREKASKEFMTYDATSILIVDDDETFRKGLTRYLSNRGYQVWQAVNLTEARQLVHDRVAEVTLLDCYLPDGNGTTLIPFLQEMDPDAVVIMTSANRNLNLVLDAMRAGACDFLAKPLDLGKLDKKLDDLLEKRKARIDNRSYQIMLEEAVSERTTELGEALEELSRINTLMASAYEEMLELLRRAAAYRDDDTGHHVSRIQLFTAELARAYGLDEPSVQMISRASTMHDIGKIGIPDQILLKPGKLSKDEWQIMMSHTTIGANIIGKKKTPLLDNCRAIAMTHHEKWDGNGYPAGLSGKNIPLAGRLVAIVDVFDALTHERVYKPAFSIDDSTQIIKDASGSHFDPDIVDCFLPLIPRLREIEASFNEEISAEVLSLHARRQQHAAG